MANFLLKLLTVVFLAFVFVLPSHSQIIQPNFSTTTGWTLLGNARSVSNTLELTNSSYNYVGAAWYNVKQPVYRNWEVSFQFKISETGGEMQYSFDSLGQDVIDSGGGDGLAFVIQSESTIAMGREGGNMGYDPIMNSLAVEFDAWPNYPEESKNHIAIHIGGWASYNLSTLNRRVGYVDLDTLTSRYIQLDDSQIHTATIRYYGYRLSVYIDDCQNPLLSISIRLDNILFYPTGTAWVGLTAATGSAIERHQIYNFNFNPYNRYDTISVVDTICGSNPISIYTPYPQYTWTWTGGYVADTIQVSYPGRYYAACNEPFVYPSTCYSTNLVYIVDVVKIDTPAVAVNLQAYNVLCGTTNLTAIAKPSTHSGYLWSNMNGRIVRGDSVVLDTGIWYLTVSDIGLCESTYGPFQIAMRPSPSLVDSIIYTCDSGAWFSIRFPDVKYQYEWDNGSRFPSRTVGIGSYWYRIVGDSCFTDTGRISVSKYADLPTGIQSQILCPGNVATFDFSDSTGTYMWSDGLIGNVTVLGPGTYWVYRISPYGCQSRTDTFTISYFSLQKPIIEVDSWNKCEGDTIHAWIQNRDSFAGIMWMNGSMADTIFLTSNSSIYVNAVTLDGCPTVSDTSTITFSPRDTIRISVLTDTTRCGDSVILIHNMSGRSVIWTTGQVDDTIVVYHDGTYGISLLDGTSCGSLQDSVQITMSKPGTFKIMCLDSMLMTEDGRIADWYWKGIFQGRDSTIIGRNQGNYWAVDSNGNCVSYSDTLQWEMATLTIGTATVNVGDTFYIPITISTTTQTYWEVRFKFKNLYPLPLTFSGTDEIIIPYRKLSGTVYSNTTFLVPFISMFGDSNWTALEGSVYISSCGTKIVHDGWVLVPENCFTNPALQSDSGGATRIIWIKPNPTTGSFTVSIYVGFDAGNVALFLSNNSGDIVRTFVGIAATMGGAEYTFDISDLSSGTYWLRLGDVWNSTSEKLILNK